MAKLYLIATPIGNRKDITIRALETLLGLEILYCEDTRRTVTLLRHYQDEYKDLLGKKNIPQLRSCFEHNEMDRASEIIGLLKNGTNVGLVSNAGTPTISDPGFRVVKECLDNDYEVVSIPGPCAIITALTSSGLSADKVTFLGFLPRKQGKQNKIWEDIKNLNLAQTVVFYESPFRLQKVLTNIEAVFGDIEVIVARELTKKFEEVAKAKISDWKNMKSNLKGELVLLFRKE
jgi:16S rRNA (cytidine1402-2'-O)-methyltransferase